MHTMPKLTLGLFLLAACLSAGPGVWAQAESYQAEPAMASPESAANDAEPPAENHETAGLLRAAGHSWIAVKRQAENHLLITIGDLVYFSAARQTAMQAGEVYPIYQTLDRGVGQPPSREARWMRLVGKLEVVAGQEGLSIGRVIAARDIIQAGDQVLLRTE